MSFIDAWRDMWSSVIGGDGSIVFRSGDYSLTLHLWDDVAIGIEIFAIIWLGLLSVRLLRGIIKNVL